MRSPSPIRVRFAPSPTGHLHVGNARTALFNWLFARQQKGSFILRIEDTDVERSQAQFEQQLLADLRWLGLDWDEGPDVGGPYPPYRQSEKLERYRSYAENLVREGKAYYCFCSEEELRREREEAVAAGRNAVYSGRCRRLDEAEVRRRVEAGEPRAVRLRIPEHPIRFRDIVRGEVEFPAEAISDPIIVRSAPAGQNGGRDLGLGMPVYNYVVVIDDIEMKISHVIRGDDHISNTPRQVALYEALGAPIPEFAHLSTILGSDRERLSKRHGATSISNFRELGVVPEALMNYLALLGWAPSGGTRELFSKEELIRDFRLERVTPSAAIFDFDKLYWLNRQYIKAAMSDAGGRRRLLAWAREYLVERGWLGQNGANQNAAEMAWIERLLELLAPYLNRLGELPGRSEFLFRLDPRVALEDPKNLELLRNPKSLEVLRAFERRVEDQPSGPLRASDFKLILEEVKRETGARGSELFHPVRLALTGSSSGPDFDKLIPVIEEGHHLPLPAPIASVRERIRRFLEAIAQPEREASNLAP